MIDKASLSEEISMISGYRVPCTFLANKFQVISRFCPGQKGHSPGYSVDNFDTRKADARSVPK